MFKTYKPVNDSTNTITIPNGTKIPVKNIGNIILTPDIELHNALHVPGFQFNLISVHKLCQDMLCTLSFTADKCFIQGHLQKGPPLLLGNLSGGLYGLEGFKSQQIASTSTYDKHCNQTSSVNIDDSQRWHTRLGHLPFTQFKHIPSLAHLKDCKDCGICQVCPAAKQTRSSFPSSSIKTTHAFQLIHIDVWGPYRQSTHNGFTQFLTIVDDFTRTTWIHLLKYKTDVMNDFCQYVETQYNTKILCVRSDNAKELVEGAMLSFYKKKGIASQSSCRDTPQQNGVVERKHRHLLETARALAFQSNLPSKYWGECVLCATYLINRMPLSSLQWLSPYEKLHSQSPTLTHLKSFGCLCFISTSKIHRSKFAPRAHPGVFIGYPLSQKGYKVLDLSTQKIIVTRDIIFHEDHFPFHLSNPTAPNIHPTFLPSHTTLSQHDTPDPNFQSLFTPPRSPAPTLSRSPADSAQTPSPSTVFSPHSPSPTSHISPSPSPIPLRHSTRQTKLPAYLQDYHVPSAHCASTHWCNLVSFNSLPTSHKALLSTAATLVEPTSFLEASQDSNWIEAMNKEVQALESNHTWDVVSLPPNKKPIGCKWVYKLKLKADGTLERYKARLVAKGFTQKYGIDFEETFSPVIKMTTVRCLLAVASHNKWPLHQLDINNAFLHGELNEEVYMKMPPGIPNPTNQVCRLRKSLYGLKQASRQWFAKLLSALQSLGYTQSKNDYSLFIKRVGTHITIAAVYVDDIILTGTDQLEILALKSHLHTSFSIKDLGQLSFFLGIEVATLSTGIVLTHSLRNFSPFVIWIYLKRLLHHCQLIASYMLMKVLMLLIQLISEP